MKMKRFVAIACSLLVALTGMAQEVETYSQRSRIKNYSEYDNISTTPALHRVGSLSSASLPCTGSPSVPVILVQFQDTKFVGFDEEGYIQEFYHKFCNGSGIEGKRYSIKDGIYGSVSDYFIEQSDSLFRPEFQVIGPITLSKGFAYYGAEHPTNKNINDYRINEFFREACSIAVQDYNVEWSDFDNNNDGTVDFVFFIYAGLGQNDLLNDDPNTIWPCEMVTPTTINSIRFGGYGCTCELVRIRTYNITTGVTTVEDKTDGIGTMCHELSHGMGLPDFYDYNYEEFGLDYWDLMDAGCYQMAGNQPCGYSAYERDFMGWRELKKVEKDEAVTLTLDPIEAGGYGYVITNDGRADGNEYFILENRQNIGFDQCLGCNVENTYWTYNPCHGLLITHVDYSLNSWTSNRLNTGSLQRMTLVPADQTLLSSTYGYTSDYHLSLRGDCYPGNQNVTEMSSYDVRSGTFTQTITDIVENADGTITVKINGGSPVPDDIDDVTTQKPLANTYFSLSGQQQTGLQKGVNIVKYADGTIKKVLKK